LEKVFATRQQTAFWTEEAFDVSLNTFDTQFNRKSFYENSEYLVWFQGKDFAKSIQLLLNDFPTKDYYKFAKTRFDYTLFEDLVELRQEIQQFL
jgi:hypothetical protein